MFPKNIHCSVLVRGLKSKYLSPFSVHSFYCADCLIVIGQVFAFVSSVFRSEKCNNSVVNKLEKRIAQDFGLTLNVQKRVFRSVFNWYGQQIIMYLFLLLKTFPYIFSCAGNEPLIAAAKAAKIPVLELRYGSPARGKLNYDYSSGITKTNFPDYFLSFGQYWSRSLSLPLSSRKIINFGFPYLYQKLNYSEVPKENCLFVISQSVMHPHWLNLLLKLRVLILIWKLYLRRIRLNLMVLSLNIFLAYVIVVLRSQVKMLTFIFCSQKLGGR